MRSDIEIAQSIKLRPISEIASSLGIETKWLSPYGHYMAKINPLLGQNSQKKGKLILVSAITPTPAGEGKTTVSVGLSMALSRIGKKAIVTLREPSLGPLFGMKGGAAGGGKSQVLPMENINMHFTGDLHAITTAHNLISAFLDNHIYRRNAPLFNPRRIVWDRVIDMNDRSLRNITIGLGGRFNGVPRETGFHITASSEIMAILCFAESFEDLKEKVGNIRLGYTYEGKAVFIRNLGIAGSVTAVLKDALFPNLVQTTEHTPAFIHGGPFANIAQGTCSILSMKMASKLADFVVTEAGFGFDLGAEKFFDIVSPKANLDPKLVVLVATIRALKMHGGIALDKLKTLNPKAVEKGVENLKKHLENISKFNMPAIVALNRFATDSDEEIAVVRNCCKELNAEFALADVHAKGGEGGIDLAEKVVKLANLDKQYKAIYNLNDSVKRKIEIILSEIYGANAVDFTKEAKKDLRTIEKLGFSNLPVCIAKTQKSLSDNPKLLGVPRDFLVTVRRILISSGAGFLVPITGSIMLMPGLPKKPSAMDIDIDENGKISGLF